MRRLLSLGVATIMIMFAVQATAQNLPPVKVEINEEGLKKKLAKSDEAIAHAKKSTKVSTWLDRGLLFAEIADAPTKGLYVGLVQENVTTMFGTGITTKKMVNKKEYEVIAYPYFDVYMLAGKVAFWKVNKRVVDGALDKSLESLYKAYEMDAKSEPEVKEALQALSNICRQEAGGLFSILEYKGAAKMFRKAYDIDLHPSINVIDTTSVFNAGYINTIALDYEAGVPDLIEVLKYGYDKEGETQYYLFHCYYGLKDYDNARKVLMQALGKYPTNDNIIEGLLALYTTTGGDPNEIIPIITTAIENNPKNSNLWSGLGGIYDKLGNTDESIKAFQKAAELEPNDYRSQFNLGLLFVRKGDVIGEEVNNKEFSSQTKYDEAFKKVFALYIESLGPLEKALELSPNDKAVVDLLKSITFRLRDQEGMAGKYEKYNAMHKALQQ